LGTADVDYILYYPLKPVICFIKLFNFLKNWTFYLLIILKMYKITIAYPQKYFQLHIFHALLKIYFQKFTKSVKIKNIEIAFDKKNLCSVVASCNHS